MVKIVFATIMTKMVKDKKDNWLFFFLILINKPTNL